MWETDLALQVDVRAWANSPTYYLSKGVKYFASPKNIDWTWINVYLGFALDRCCLQVWSSTVWSWTVIASCWIVTSSIATWFQGVCLKHLTSDNFEVYLYCFQDKLLFLCHCKHIQCRYPLYPTTCSTYPWDIGMRQNKFTFAKKLLLIALSVIWYCSCVTKGTNEPDQSLI